MTAPAPPRAGGTRRHVRARLALKCLIATIFIGALAAYTFGRQLLFPLRANPHTVRGRALVMVLTGLVIAVDVAVAAFSR